MVRISLLLFKLMSIWCVWYFNCYYFAECFSFVESFKIRSSNIRNDVIRMKCWMKQKVNQYSTKILLDEPENVGWKTCSQSNFNSTRFLFIQHDFFLFCYFCVLINRSNISFNIGIFVMLNEMLDRLNKTFRKFLKIQKKKIYVHVSL